MVTKGEREAVMFERGVWAVFGTGDNLATMSVGGEKVPEKNETATDFRL